jgi:hypothetical protein
MSQRDAPATDRTAPRGRGFRHSAGLIEAQLRATGEKRGFAVTRLLTRWDEVVGAEIARLARPVKLGWGRGAKGRGSGLGATLTLVTSGAAAPMVQMMIPQIRERVNACYGYHAVSQILLTQTAPAMPAAGFAEGQADFAPAPATPRSAPRPDPAVEARAAALAGGVADAGLRAALETLARNVLSRADRSKEPVR